MKTQKYYAIELLLDSARGTTIPSAFYKDFDFEAWGLDKSKYSELELEDNEGYWDVWHELLDAASYKFKDDSGLSYTLWQDGDLWAICPELMTDSEYENFFREPRE